MLKNIDALLGSDALCALCAMGHADEVVICDSHYPSEGVGRLLATGTSCEWVVRIRVRHFERYSPCSSWIRNSSSILPSGRWSTTSWTRCPHVQREAQAALEAAACSTLIAGTIPRQNFYERSKKAFLMIQTGETSGWGCFILRKRLLVAPDAPAKDGKRVKLGSFIKNPIHAVLVEAERQLGLYFEGNIKRFTLPLDFEGTAFQRRVWEAL